MNIILTFHCILKVYMNWANSLLEGDKVIQDITQIQHGLILCQLIDLLDKDAKLQQKVEVCVSYIIYVALPEFTNDEHLVVLNYHQRDPRSYQFFHFIFLYIITIFNGSPSSNQEETN